MRIESYNAESQISGWSLLVVLLQVSISMLLMTEMQGHILDFESHPRNFGGPSKPYFTRLNFVYALQRTLVDAESTVIWIHLLGSIFVEKPLLRSPSR